MAQTPRDRLNHEKDIVDEMFDDGELDTETRDALLEWADALDKTTTRRKYIDDKGTIKTLEPRSIENYLQAMRLCEQRGLDLLACTAEEFNEFIDRMHDERGLAKTTLMRYQAAAQTFYRYHDFGVFPDDIDSYTERSKPRHDEQDMFTDAEVDALREACKGYRDRALLELLVYTGQRLTALRTLRMKDVDYAQGYIYLNDEVDGLKGARKRGRKRPMFGARKYVREWKQNHPHKGKPEKPFFIGDPDHWKTKMDEPWSEPGVRNHLKRIAERAGVEKPVNPHNFRHYWVTVMKREYSLDSDTLRALMGVAKDSTVLETTYAHVTNDDYVRKAEAQLGYRDENEAQSLTPDSCPTCGELLEDHWRRCPACDELFAPTLKNVENELAETRDEVIDEAVGGDRDFTADERRALRKVLTAIDDPVAIADKLDSGDI
ncbi:tyrosine-type recombinase/integrase [Natronosalvus rutilus]|uniref:Site-specific integrase n=1 Tax=Natronosalvus rutilus TaxID=2953753 RepID=A0A9E7N915_9EURY|nr:tyrosine-type recombinase/integrase [Natronosalvus rutilus]UTF52729.1 site-specific integrase [Natronosalvus rutilus]